MFLDATKDTYNMYSCTISDMSREMMKIDGRDSAENQIWEKRDIMVIKEFEFKSHEDKIANSASSPSFNQRQKRGEAFLRCSKWFCLRGFREIWCFSLRSRAIGPLDFDGVRRENVLRGAGYAWTPDL